MLQITDHGGYCCGIKHAFTFGLYNAMTDGSREDFIKKTLENVVASYFPVGNVSVSNCTCEQCQINRDPVLQEEKRKKWSTAVEAVINGEQAKTWRQPLEACGFREVFSFKNSNSRNMCHVFYGLTNPQEIKEVKSVESAKKDTEITF